MIRKLIFVGPWTHTNEYGTTLVGVHIAGICSSYDVAHFAVRLSSPELLQWIYATTGIYGLLTGIYGLLTGAFLVFIFDFDLKYSMF